MYSSAQVVSLQLTARRLLQALMEKRAEVHVLPWLSGASAFFGLRHADGNLANDASPVVRCDNVLLKAAFGAPCLQLSNASFLFSFQFLNSKQGACFASVVRTSYMVSGMRLLWLVGFDGGSSEGNARPILQLNQVVACLVLQLVAAPRHMYMV